MTSNLISGVKRIFQTSKEDPLGAVPFPALLELWNRRCARYPFYSAPQDGARRVGVLVTPWLGTPVSFFNLEVARMLAGQGEHVHVMLDVANVFGNAASPDEVQGLRSAVNALPDSIQKISLEDCLPTAGDPEDEVFARGLLYENGVWRMRGEARAGEFVARKTSTLSALASHVSRVRHLLAESGIDWLLIPGGIWGLSSIYVEAARRAGIAFTTYDSGAQILVVCQNGVASHQADIPLALTLTESAMAARPAYRDQIIAWSHRELDERVKGRGNYITFQTQAAAGSSPFNYNVLVPLNLRWDSAALGRQRLFATVDDWVAAIVEWGAGEPLARVCIRQHPIERRAAWKSSDDVGQRLRERNPAGDRVRFIGAEEPVSTYDLLGSVRVVLPFTSSMGVEAPMLGIPVITAAHSYYEDLPFVHRAESVVHYFQLLSQSLHDGLTVSPAQGENAAIVYYLTQHCNLMPSSFTAAPADFLSWVEVSPEELWARPDTQDLQRALLTGKPLSFIRFERYLAEA
ncbi:MAG TPA: hypothetical protein VF593_01305 [Chthoniobacteraceae bacterium]